VHADPTLRDLLLTIGLVTAVVVLVSVVGFVLFVRWGVREHHRNRRRMEIHYRRPEEGE
jgi:multisubunit Na+/H+ antiporter MnhC subunit